MRFRTFIIAYTLVLAILLFADRRPGPAEQPRYSHIVDLTDWPNAGAPISAVLPATRQNADAQAASSAHSQTRIVAPDALIPGTWTADQIPPERLIAPLVVMDVNAAATSQISLDEIAAWEAQHGVVPQGAVVAIRRASTSNPQTASISSPRHARVPHPSSGSPDRAVFVGWGGSFACVGSSTTATQPAASFPLTAEAAQFLMDARYTTGFAIEAAADLASDRALSCQIALHGNYVVEGAPHLDTLPATGSLIIVAPAKSPHAGPVPVRVLAMVR